MDALVFEIGKEYTMSVTGFTFLKQFACIKGKVPNNDETVAVIIGEKTDFGMQDMFMLKQANGVRIIYKKDKEVNGTVYKQFQLQEILF